MRITIAERLRPFSHRPGTRCLIPGTARTVRCFPTRLEIDEKVFPISLRGPCDAFTVIQDLENGCVRVEGDGRCGFFRYLLFGTGIEVRKAPPGFKIEGELEPIEALPIPNERLSLGSSKKLDWELVTRRCDPREIFPLWHRLALMTPDAVEPDLPLDLQSLMDLYRAGFQSLLAPTPEDVDFQGFEAHPPAVGGGLLLRRLFLDGEKVLPSLPPQLPAGRLTGARCPYGTLDIEWTKKRLRRMVLRVEHRGEVKFEFRHLRRYRLRRGLRESGQCKEMLDSIDGVEGEILYFDCFES